MPANLYNQCELNTARCLFCFSAFFRCVFENVNIRHLCVADAIYIQLDKIVDARKYYMFVCGCFMSHDTHHSESDWKHVVESA